MVSLAGKIARYLGVSRQKRNALSVRWRAFSPHTGYREHHRVPLWHPNVPFVLITSQRAGSTLGTAWFLHHAGLLDIATSYDPFVHHYEQEVFLQVPGYFSGLERALAEKPVLKLAREPGARAYSSYLNLHTREVLDPKDHRHRLRQSVLKSEDLNPSVETPLSFATFLTWMRDADHQRLDGHEARQTNLYEAALPTVPETLQLEDIDRQLPHWEEQFSLPRSSQSQIIAFGASAHYAKKQEASHEALAKIVEEGLTPPRPGKVPRIGTAELKAFPGAHHALIQAFAEDYERLGYPTHLAVEPQPA